MALQFSLEPLISEINPHWVTWPLRHGASH